MVSAPDSEASDPGSSPGPVEFLGKIHSTVTVPLSTQLYKSVPANLMLGGTPAMD